MFKRQFAICALGGVLLTLAQSATARASINLEYRPFLQAVNVGSSFNIEFYAVSDGNPTPNQSIGSIDLILDWDPAFIQLTGLNNNGPYAWQSSDFPDDSALDDLNGTVADGNAYYRAFRALPPDPPAFATPTGLLVTTFTFQALALTNSTQLDMLASFGGFSRTYVVDGMKAGLEVTGTLGSAKIIVVPEPGTIFLGVLVFASLCRRSRRARV